jgi:hypothetical protein
VRERVSDILARVKQKGVAFRSTLLAIERLHGEGAVARVKDAMPERHRASMENILAVNWYPIEVSAALHVAIRDTIGRGEWRESHRLGVEAARIDFTGIYRAVLRAIQYDTIWDRMERAWTTYMSGGNAKWEERGHGTMRGYVEGVAGFNNGMWLATAGRMEGLLLLSGAKGASAEPSDMTPTAAKFEALWIE